MGLVARTIDECHRPDGCAAYELGQGLRRGMFAQFAPIARGKLVPARRVVSEPAAQFGAGRDVLEPGIELEIRLAHAARPEPLDQHPIAIAGTSGIVRALEQDHDAPFPKDVRQSPRRYQKCGVPRSARIKARHVAGAKQAHVHRVLEHECDEPGSALHCVRRIESSDAHSVEKGSLSKLDPVALPPQPREHHWNALDAPFVDQESCLDFELSLHARVCIHVASLLCVPALHRL